MTDLWVRSPRLGKPEALSEVIDLLRGVRDYLRVVDPLAQGLATVAELEARILEIFQAASVPRALGLTLSQLLLEFVRPYLTDGIYFITHHNLREIVERTGIAPLLDPVGRYVDELEEAALAGAEGEASALLRFGVDSSGGIVSDFRSYPQAIEGQRALAERSAIRAATNDLLENAGQFDAFGDWLNPILAAFYDAADPKRPVAAPEDKLGGLLFAVTGTDPVEVYRKFLRLQKAFSKLQDIQFNLDEVFEDLENSLGLDTLEQWKLLDSLQYGGLQLFLRPHLVPKYGTAPDFTRLSTADLLPFLSNLLVDATNLVEFAGFPYPENFALYEQALQMAERIREILGAFDETLDLITSFSDALDIAGAWRLVLAPEEGGVDGLVERIRTATRDDMVRLTEGTIAAAVDASGGISLVETRLGRVLSLPDDTSGIPEYGGQAVGDFADASTLSLLAAAFDGAGRSGFSYSPARVWRAGELVRQSELDALQRAYPGVGGEPPGNLIIFGVGMFFVEGALSRLLLEIFTPTEEEIPGVIAVPDVVSDRSDLFNLDMSAPTAPVRGVPPAGSRLDLVLSAEGGSSNPSSSLGGSSEDASVAPSSRAGGLWDGLGGGRSEIELQPGSVFTLGSSTLMTRVGGESVPFLGARTRRLSSLREELHSVYRLRRPQAILDRFLTREAPLLRTGESIELPPLSWEAGPEFFPEGVYDPEDDPLDNGLDPGLDEDDRTQAITDLTILAGGTRVSSVQLRAWMVACDLFAGESLWTRALDVTQTLSDGRSASFRVWLLETVGASEVVVYPALPLAARATVTPVAVRASLVDAPTWRITPTETGEVQSGDVVTFESSFAWLRRENLDTRPLDNRPRATMEVAAGGHLVDAETQRHAEWSAVQVAWDGEKFVVFAAEAGLDDVRTLLYLASDPPRIFHVEGVGTSGDELNLLPRDDAAAVARDASNTAVTLWALKPTSPGDEPPQSHVPTVTARATLEGRPSLGLPSAGVVSYSNPATWQAVEMLSGSTITRVELEDALNLPAADAGYTEVTAWTLSFKASFLLEHGSSQLVPVLARDAEALSAFFVPFQLFDEDDYAEPATGDAVALGFESHVRLGITARRLSAPAGCDPDQVPGAARLSVPGSASIGLRPSGARSSVLTVLTAMWAPTECARQGPHLFLEGLSYRVVWEPAGWTQTWRLFEKGLTGGETLIGEVQTARWHEGQEFELRLAFLEEDQTAVLQIGVSDALLAEIRGEATLPLEGLRAGGGGWIFGKTRSSSPVLDAEWTQHDAVGVGGEVFGPPPILLPTLSFSCSRQEAIEAALWEAP